MRWCTMTNYDSLLFANRSERRCFKARRVVGWDKRPKLIQKSRLFVAMITKKVWVERTISVREIARRTGEVRLSRIRDINETTIAVTKCSKRIEDYSLADWNLTNRCWRRSCSENFAEVRSADLWGPVLYPFRSFSAMIRRFSTRDEASRDRQRNF